MRKKNYKKGMKRQNVQVFLQVKESRNLLYGGCSYLDYFITIPLSNLATVQGCRNPFQLLCGYPQELDDDYEEENIVFRCLSPCKVFVRCGYNKSITRTKHPMILA